MHIPEPLAGAMVATALALMSGCGHVPEAPTAAGNTSSDPAQQASRCQQLAATTLAGTSATVADATLVAGKDGGSGHCLAHLAFPPSTLRAELRLPVAGWNGHLVFLGGGGFDGMFASPGQPYFSPSVTRDGYAIVSTNGGYDASVRDPGYFNAAFAHDPRKLEDFTHASEHRALPAATALVAAFYGRAPQRRYFEGCSMGGHDALILAQRYPDDFDGIVARAPAGNVVGLMLQFHRIAHLSRQAGATLPPTQLGALQTAVLDRCDARDGLRDGLVSNAQACDFDPRVLACKAGDDTGQCLSPQQLRLVDAVTTPMRTEDGRWSHPGYGWSGAESDPKAWQEYVLAQPALGGQSLQGLFSDGFLRAFVTGDDAFDTADWHAGSWQAQLQRIGALFQADSPALGDFHARGGKLILWNGTADTSVSARDTVRYYEAVRRSLGNARADATTELILAPGVGHCGGGPGAGQIDLMQALSRWVEDAIPPSRQALVQQRPASDALPALSRPACVHPAYAHYRGSGDIHAASSFICTEPSPPNR